MAGNTLLKYFFSSGSEVDPEGQFNLTRKSRTQRLREIYTIMQKHHFTKGFTPESFRSMLEGAVIAAYHAEKEAFDNGTSPLCHRGEEFAATV